MNEERENDSSASSCSASLVMQAKDPFRGWETWGEGVTREAAEAWKARKESEPAIYCKMEYRIFEQNAKDLPPAEPSKDFES